MKDIKLCGLGNGLLDLQYEVTDNDIIRLGLKKGEMRLVSPAEQTEILDSINKRSFNKCSGGSAANTIIGFANFGGKAAYQTSLGNDEFGHFYADEFKELGIELKSEFLSQEPTGTCLVLITPDSERTMNTSLGASALFDINHVSENLIQRSEWVYIEGYKLTSDLNSDAVFKAIDLAKKHNTKISFTFSDVFIVEIFREKVEKVVKNSDLIFCNENEAFAFTRENSLDLAFSSLCNHCENVVLTMGSKGSMVKYNNEIFDIPSYPANPVDSTGAGDMFAGGFLYGILYGGSGELGGHLGSFAASKVVSQMGARLNDDYNTIKNKIFAQYK